MERAEKAMNYNKPWKLLEFFGADMPDKAAPSISSNNDKQASATAETNLEIAKVLKRYRHCYSLAFPGIIVNMIQIGGIILLGVKECKDKSLYPVELTDPDKLIKEFWDIINDQNKVSVNLLTDRDVTAQDVAGNHTIEPGIRQEFRDTHIHTKTHGRVRKTLV